MNRSDYISRLEDNLNVFGALLKPTDTDMVTWRPAAGKWNLLEIVCHLYDEEVDDFRARVTNILVSPELPFKPIDPVGWVVERNYQNQDFNIRLEMFLAERQRSVDFLKTQQDAEWTNVHHHPTLGAMSATMMLANWLAHDYLHIRQINSLKYNYLAAHARENLSYAGDW